MAIIRLGDHTIYTDGDCPPGHVIMGDAIIPEVTYLRMSGKITPEEEKQQLQELREKGKRRSRSWFFKLVRFFTGG